MSKPINLCLAREAVFCALVSLSAICAISCGAQSNEVRTTQPRVLEVDRLGSTPYQTLASVVKIVQPGDTIRVKPNTGPYREILSIRTSGTAQKPITFDGGNNVFTAFDPINAWEEKDGKISTCLKVFPCVIAYNGERLVQDATTGQFTKYADLDEAKQTLTLRPGVSKTGWEVSTRAFAVQVSDVAHLIYKNVRASGSTNDGFNLHGIGTDLTFENIEGFFNLDEGFSTHDSIQSVVRCAKFWGNDNGIANSYVDKTTLSSTFIDTDVYDNLGFGLSLHDCAGKLKNVRIWNNGLRQLRFNAATVDCEDVVVYTPQFTTRQFVSYMDSKDTTKMIPYGAGETTVTGTPPRVEKMAAPPDVLAAKNRR